MDKVFFELKKFDEWFWFNWYLYIYNLTNDFFFNNLTNDFNLMINIRVMCYLFNI